MASDPRMIESPLEVRQSGDTIFLSASLNTVSPSETFSGEWTVVETPFPTDVASFGDDGLALLDRLDGLVYLTGDDGAAVDTWGGLGDGPGEYREPYAIAASGSHYAVWDKDGRLTTLKYDGEVVATTLSLRGDLPAVWQRMPSSFWEEPLQLSREDVTRRLWGMGGGRFGVMLQDRDERVDPTFEPGAERRRYPYHIIVFDSLAVVVDTLATLRGPEIWNAWGSDAQRFAFARERPFALRPLWTAGAGWHAYGHGDDNAVSVIEESGRVVTVTWPRDSRALGENDFDAHIDWQLEGIRRTLGDELADRNESRLRESGRNSAYADLDIASERPQIVGLMGSGRCLFMAGFGPEGGPHGERGVWVVVDLRERTATAIEIAVGPGFVRSVEAGDLVYIEVAESGERLVRRVPLVGIDCFGR